MAGSCDVVTAEFQILIGKAFQVFCSGTMYTEPILPLFLMNLTL